MLKGSFWFPFILLATASALTLKTAYLPATDKGLAHIPVREALPYVREAYSLVWESKPLVREDESCVREGLLHVRETLTCVREHLPCVREYVSQHITD